ERWLDSHASAGAERDVDRAGIAERSPRWRTLLDPVPLALVAVSALYLAWFLGHGTAPGGDASHASSPYAMAFDRTVPLNLLTYLGWTVNCIVLTVRSFNDAVDPRVFAAGGAALVLWLAGWLWKPLRDRGWLLAGLWMATFLAPVLVLKNHTYHYYLYAPLVGAGWCLGALLDAAFERRSRTVAPPTRPKPARVS